MLRWIFDVPATLILSGAEKMLGHPILGFE
jgi:hypothetical protein